MRIDILTLFPQWFSGDSPLAESILARARERGLLDVRAWNIRDWTDDRHHVVDDTPYGGGGGMVLKPEPLARALDAVAGPPGAPGRPRVILTSPQGRHFTQEVARELAALERIVIVCGHYEALDERVIETRIDEEISIGDVVVTGGEIPAMLIVDAVARMVPGVLGNPESAPRDSFFDGVLFDCPHFTRPEEFEGRRVPDILLSGHHARIVAWRRERALLKTARVRPELVADNVELLVELRDLLAREPEAEMQIGPVLREKMAQLPPPPPPRKKRRKRPSAPPPPDPA